MKKGLRLTLAIHRDAFLAGPGAYLTACWSRLRGKRLRARHQFARLLGTTPRAYDLWRSWHEERDDLADVLTTPPIVVILESSGGDWRARVKSLGLAARDVMVLPIGTGDVPSLADAIGRIDWSERPWLMPIAAGDALAPGAIAAYRRAAAETESCVIYADDDVLDDRQNRTNPHFKPGWNSELFRHFDYLTSSCMVRAPREAMEAVAGADDWAQRITAQMAEEGAPLHIPKVLHHRRSRPGPRLAAPSPADPDVDLPLVTVIIPTRNRVDLLRTCLEGVAATDYPAVEVIIVDNDSDDQETLDFLDSLDPVRYRVLRYSGPFNYSAINNHAVAQARGQLLCLLNNDIEVMEPDWLSLMVAQAIRDNVGAVGARLLYPDGRIQHAGVVMGMGHAAGHAHRLLRPDDEGYFHRHSLPQFVSAVTAACLVVQRGRFLSVGGLDAQNFAVAFNDVDLCLRLNKRGWQSFYEPRATLIHHESVSRGFDRDPVGQKRFAGELAALQRLWGTETIVDPYHHPELSRASETFVVRL